MKAFTIALRMRDGSRIAYGCIAPTSTDACMAAHRRFWGQIASARVKPVRGRA